MNVGELKKLPELEVINMKYLLLACLLLLMTGCHQEGARQIVIWDDEFKCTKSHDNDWIQLVKSGDTTIPIYHHDVVCDQYTRYEGATP